MDDETNLNDNLLPFEEDELNIEKCEEVLYNGKAMLMSLSNNTNTEGLDEIESKRSTNVAMNNKTQEIEANATAGTELPASTKESNSILQSEAPKRTSFESENTTSSQSSGLPPTNSDSSLLPTIVIPKLKITPGTEFNVKEIDEAGLNTRHFTRLLKYAGRSIVRSLGFHIFFFCLSKSWISAS